MKFLILCVALVSFATTAMAQGLMIHAAEIGIGKFHRHDNKVHKYAPNNVWSAYVAPQGGAVSPVIVDNPDNSVSIQFTSLEQLLQSVMQISNAKHQKIAILNISAHGMPGGT